MRQNRVNQNRRIAPVPRNKPKINWKVLFHSFVLSLLVSLLGVYILQTPDLEIRYVKPTGVHLADSIKVDDITDKAIKQNILLFRKGAMFQELSDIDEIQSVEISRKFPDTIQIKVTEREPIATLKLKNGYAYIGVDGLAFHKSPLPAPKKPVIYAAGCDKIELRKPDPTANFEYAMNVLKNVRAKGFACNKISVDQRANMCLNMSSGLLIKLGQPDDLTTKFTQLRRAFEYEKSLEREALYVDISCPSAIAYMPKGARQGVL